MLFNSWEFLILLGAVFAGYYLPVPVRIARVWQVAVLLAGSAVFYGWERPGLLWLLFASCLGNSLATARIIGHRLAGAEARMRRWVAWAVALNLALLAAFKYAGWLAGWVPGLSAEWLALVRAIPLPVGISFFTFHAISMIVDVARGEVNREGDELLEHGRGIAGGVRDLGLYLLFFPQLVAGPIVKAKDFWPQIRAKRFGAIDWRVAWRCLLTGYFLKLVVADNLAEQTALLADPAARLAFFGPLNLLVLTYAYALQIFADFGGYSLIAIGLAALFGYRLPENFRFPYLATSVTEFWRRWHMTLSAWLRDYLYLPLGGNRKGPARTSLNLLLVMFLGGLWHGAAWKFAWWGVGHGVLLGGERLLFRRRGKLVEVPRGGWLRPLCGWCYTFHAVCLLWLPFCLPDMAAVVDYCRACGERWWVYPPVCFAAVVFGSLGVLHHAWGWLGEHRPQRAERWARPWAEGLVHGVMLFLLCTNAGAPRGFIYFQF